MEKRFIFIFIFTITHMCYRNTKMHKGPTPGMAKLLKHFKSQSSFKVSHPFPWESVPTDWALLSHEIFDEWPKMDWAILRTDVELKGNDCARAFSCTIYVSHLWTHSVINVKSEHMKEELNSSLPILSHLFICYPSYYHICVIVEEETKYRKYTDI